MKKLLFIGLFICLCSSSFGQKIRFTDSTNVWKGFRYDSDYGGIVFSSPLYSSSTVIDGQRYYDMNGNFLREDTIAHMVFIRYYNSSTGLFDTTDDILYNYNWIIGDTVKHDDYYPPSIVWVDSVDSVQINTLWYKVWHFTGRLDFGSSSDPIGYSIIEGIGCVNGPTWPAKPVNAIEFGDWQLTCFNTEGTTPLLSRSIPMEFGHSFDNSTSCTLATSQLSLKTKTAMFFPNPIDKTSKIVLSYSIASGTLIVLNDVGQVIIDQPVQNKNALQIGDKIKLPGIYYYRVTDNESGKAFSGKFVAQ